jgi:hypothetical protein
MLTVEEGGAGCQRLWSVAGARSVSRYHPRECQQKSSNRKQCKRKAKQRAKKKAASERLTPVWSPDSTKLLFQRFFRHGKVDLWTVNVDGSGLSKLTRTQSLAQYAWGTAPVGGL